MALLQITLTNPNGDRLTQTVDVASRTTAGENEAHDIIQERVNANADHAKYGPWTVRDSTWQH